MGFSWAMLVSGRVNQSLLMTTHMDQRKLLNATQAPHMVKPRRCERKKRSKSLRQNNCPRKLQGGPKVTSYFSRVIITPLCRGYKLQLTLGYSLIRLFRGAPNNSTPFIRIGGADLSGEKSLSSTPQGFKCSCLGDWNEFAWAKGI